MPRYDAKLSSLSYGYSTHRYRSLKYYLGLSIPAKSLTENLTFNELSRQLFLLQFTQRNVTATKVRKFKGDNYTTYANFDG